MRRALAISMLVILASTAALASNWFVDPAATGTNNGTSWTNAWTSTAAIVWASVQPGDTVFLSGGSSSQNYSGVLGTPKSGTSGNLVTISVGQDAGHNGTVIFNGGGTTMAWLSGSFSFVNVTGNVGGVTHLTVQGYGAYIWLCTATCTNDTLQYAFFPSMTAGFHFSNGANNSGLEISHIETHKTGNATYDDTFYLAANTSYATPAHTVKIHDSQFYIPVRSSDPGIGDDGFKWPAGLDFYNNYVKAVLVTYNNTQHADMFQLVYSNTSIFNNTFEDIGESIVYYDPFNTSLNGAGHDLKIYNNLFVQTNQTHTTVARGMDLQPEGGAQVSCTNFIVANNTFVDWVNISFFARFNGFSSYNNCYAKNNAARNTGGSSYVLDPGVGSSNNVNGTIAFVNYALFGGSNNDLHLTSGDTVARNQGIFLPDIPAVDKGGNLRPAASPWDAGAYQSSGAPPVLTASLSPTSANFGSLNVGQTSAPQTINLAAAGGTLAITSIVASGDYLQSNSCPASLSSGGTCSISVTFSPSATGTRSGTLTVTSNATNSPTAASLTGVGTQPTVAFSPTSVSFGNQNIGTTSANQTVGLSNGGTGPLTISAKTITGANASDFSQTNNCPATLAAGASCSFTLTFHPAALGAKTASLSVTDNATGSPHTVPLTGTGTGTASVLLSPTSLTFSGQTVGTVSASQPVTLTNNGTAPLTITSITTSLSDFAQTNNCTSPIAASASCTINVTFTPAAAGSRAGNLVISDNAAGSPHLVSLQGTGTQAALGLAPSSLTFAGQNTGTSSATQTIVLTNTGTATLSITSITVTGTNAGDFSRTTTCGATVAASATCNIVVTFTPTATGGRNAAITIVDSAPGSPHTAALTGTGTSPAVSLSPTSLAFGSQIVNLTSSPQDITLTNTGTGTLTVASVTLTGANANQFTQTNTCVGTVLAGATCTVTVRFAPTSTGAKTASVTITDNATGSPRTVSLTGTGIQAAPQVSLSPSSLTFSSQTVGSTSAGQVVTLTNTGNATLNIASIVAAGDYARVTTCGATVAASGTCTITVTFTPTATGTRSGTITITDDALGSPHSVPLRGTGTAATAPIATISPSSLTFASQTTGTTSAAQVVTLQNTGNATLNITSIVASGDYARTTTCAATLAISASCTVSVTFTPTAIGTRTGTLTFTDDAAGSPQTVSLTGMGVAPSAPAVSLDNNSLTYGNQIVGSTSTAQTVTMTNTGTATLNITSITVTGTNAGDYARTTTCASTLLASASCTISVTFTPTAVGTRTAAVTIVDDANNSPQTIALTGVGQSGSPIATVSPSSLTFAAQIVGTTSTAKNVTVTNTGTATLTISSVTLTGTNSGDYARTLSNCVSVTINATCTIGVRFTPSALGTRTATLNITDNAAGSPQTVSLTGTGTGPSVSFSPTSVAFASTAVGSTTAATIVRMNNTGNAVLSGIVVSLTGTNPGDFSFTNLGGNRCRSTLNAGGFCQVSVFFTPTTTGARSANLHFVDSASDSPQDVALTGTGVATSPTVTLNPTSLTYGAQQISTTSASQTIVLTNSGTATLNITSIVASGDYANTTTCGATLAASATCNISVTFTPTATGTRTGAITITDNATGSPHVASLTGTGTPAPAPTVSLSPASLTFGLQQTGTTSAAQTITLSNIGTASLSITSITLTGTNSADYGRTTTCGATLAAGTSCTISVTFTPIAAGTRTASVTFTNDASGSPQTVSLTGTGFVGTPQASPSPLVVNFGNQPLLTPSSSLPVTLANPGSAALSITSIAASGDYSETNNCGSSLAAGASCTVSVVFTPTVPGTGMGTLTFIDNASSSPQTVSLTGNGTGALVTLNPTSLSFGSVVQGVTSPAQTITLANSGNITLTVNSITRTGTNASDFAQTNNCLGNVAAGGSCTISVTFTPGGTGARSASISIADSAFDSPQTVSLTGTGLTAFPIVSLSPTSLNFGSIQQGSTTASQSVTLTNTGTTMLNITSVTKTGTNPGDYTLTNGCGATLAVSASCIVSATFTPASTGTRTANLHFIDDASDTPQNVAMTGIGLVAPAPVVSLSPTSLTFTSQQTGTTSAAKIITLSNTGDATLNITSITVTGANAGDYARSTTCGPTLAASASCTVSVTFTPTAAGTRTASVTFTDDASGSPQSVSMSGTAFVGAPAVSLSVTTLIFLPQVMLTTSFSQAVALTNTGTATLLITSITATGDYAQSNNCGSSVVASASCVINVTFTPTALGTRTGSIALVTNDPDPLNPHSVALTGSGISAPPPPTIQVAVGIGQKAGIGGLAGMGVQISLTPVNPPDYNTCTNTVPVQTPGTAPFTGRTGTNTVVSDPEPSNGSICFHNPMVRITDATLDPSQPNRTVTTDCAGSGDSVTFNADSTLLMVCNTGTRQYPMTFNAATMQVARMYVAANPTTGGMFLGQDGLWSRSNPLLYYFMQGTQLKGICFGTSVTGTLCNGPIDLATQPTAGNGRIYLVFDFASGTNCIGTGFLPTWTDVGSVASGDSAFAVAFSNTGAQNTATYAAVYTIGKGCSVERTNTGLVSSDWGANGTVNLTDHFRLHNIELSKDGNWMILAPSNCLNTCSNASSPYAWQVGTNNLVPLAKVNHRTGGHWTEGYTHWVNNAGTTVQFSFFSRLFTSPDSPVLVNPAAPANVVAPLDNHPSWNNVDTGDTFPFFTSTWTSFATYPGPYYNEVVAINPITGVTYRFAHNYITGINQRFGTKFGIGQVSQDGRWFMFSSDMLGRLGSEAGGSTCTSGTNCRGDVFVVKLQ